MVDHDDDTNDTDEHDDSDHDHSTPAMDPFLTAIALCQIAERAKPITVALKKLRTLTRAIGTAERKLAALTTEAEQTKAALAEREAEFAAREAALDARTAEFEASLAEAHATLRASHDSLAQEDRRIRYRILSAADLLHGYNERLQDLPDWVAIKQMIPGLPDDLPAASTAEVVSENVREDWAGSVFVPGSTLTRSINKAARQ